MIRRAAIGAGDDWPIVPPGIWLEARNRKPPTPQPGLFLDRDGVIVHLHARLHKHAQALFVDVPDVAGGQDGDCSHLQKTKNMIV